MKKSIEISPNIETLFGTRDENLRLLEDGLNINIDLRSDSIDLEGASRDVARAEQVFADYDHLQRSGFTFNNGDLGSMLRVLRPTPKLLCAAWRRLGASARSGGVRSSPRASTSGAIWKPSRITTWYSGSARREPERPT